MQTDPAFNIVFQSLKEIGNQNRLQQTHVQAATLTNIESNNDDEELRNIFGGKRKELANSAFGRTASAVVRMCMLEATGVPRSIKWPWVGETRLSYKIRSKILTMSPWREIFILQITVIQQDVT